MKKVYVVQENFTCAFMGLFDDKTIAEKTANEIGGEVITYNLEKVQYDTELWGDILPEA